MVCLINSLSFVDQRWKKYFETDFEKTEIVRTSRTAKRKSYRFIIPFIMICSYRPECINQKNSYGLKRLSAKIVDDWSWTDGTVSRYDLMNVTLHEIQKQYNVQ